MKNFLIAAAGLMCFHIGSSQMQTAPPDDWFNLEMGENSVLGIGTNKAYEQLLGKKGKEVVVAVLDNGVDIDHPDLRGHIWVNEKEIAGNGVDDDGNGYIDDINGWNFIGGPDGDVEFDNLEFTRHYKSLKHRFDGKTKGDVPKADRKAFTEYESYSQQYNKRVADKEKEAEEFGQIMMVYEFATQTFTEYFGRSDFSIEDLLSIEEEDEYTQSLVEFMVFAQENNLDAEIDEGMRHYTSVFEYAYNLDINTRSIVGDDPSNLKERFYGNNHAKGPNPDHGTHVAGIIAAVRNNSIGINGIADHVKIMSVRIVPDGDERDKDVANAIRYAVDNGADIINMSFGKSLSPHKDLIDAAVQYAAEKDVLLVHAAGNDGRNNDKRPSYPNARYKDSKATCALWIEVGASSWNERELIAPFSNFGRKTVDLFAPGLDIYSLKPQESYGLESGTSMAAPVVSGMAAVVMSYYPDLSALAVKNILIESAQSYKKTKIIVPDSGKRRPYKKICKSGAVANLNQAIIRAEEQ